MKQRRDRILPLIDHALKPRPADIPDVVLYKAAELFVDTLACIYAGSSAEGIAGVRQMLEGWGGKPQATILGFGEKTSAPNAALINAAMGHARDFDDTHDAAVNHSCVILVPALLAVTEYLEDPQPPAAGDQTRLTGRTINRTVSGAEFAAALAIGVDIANRLGLAFIPYLHVGWLPTTLWGPIACAAACGRLLRLDAEQMTAAFGLAYAQIHGNRQALVDGALAKRLQPAFSARAGIESAFMAAHGLTAGRGIIDGAFGIPALYTTGRIDAERLTEGLGRDYETMNASIKPYPSCRCTHPVIDAVLSLKEQHGFDADAVDSGLIRLPPQSMGQIGNPFSLRDNPTVDAQFSAQYTAALTCIQGRPRLKDFEAATVRAAGSVQELASRFTVEMFEPEAPGLVPVEVSLSLRDGRGMEVRIDTVTGSRDKPLTEAEQRLKFDDCLDHGLSPGTAEWRERLLEKTAGLLGLKSMAKVTELL